ncbi:MAG: FAD-dependent oxidoreductase [Candidatus Omnitrophica bacterium]|nr:FAD-dependent oxidoreductase [Candidatus Omnitrophota bacterium]
MISKHNKVVILGGGIAGLSAGFKLVLDGIPVEIIEAEDEVGGLARTIEYKGFYFDLGGHRFFTEDKEIMDFVKGIMKDNLLHLKRKSEIWFNNHYLKYPLEIMDLFQKIEAKRFFKYVKDYLLRGSSKYHPLTFRDWVVGEFGEALYNDYFGPYTKKFWGIEPTEISADWARERIPLIRATDLLVDKFFSSHRSFIKHFYFPKRGIGEIARRIAREIEKRGGKIICGGRVKEVVIENNRIIAVLSNKGYIEGDFFISTLPITELVRFINNNEIISRSTQSINFRSLIILNILIKGENINNNQWIYFPNPNILFHRIQMPFNWSSLMVPEGKSSLSLEIACKKGDNIYNLSTQDIFDRCISDLKDIGFDIRDRVEDYFIVKVPWAYPIYKLGYEKSLNTIMGYLNNFTNLILCGRSGLFKYNNLDQSIRMGLEVGKYLLGKR